MAYIIKMPKLGLEMEQGTVLEWYADPDDEVAEGDMLVEVESEKSIGEVDAREDGAIRRIFIEEGESVPPGTPIGILAGPDADIGDLEAEAEAELEAEAPDAVTAGSEAGDSDSSDEMVETATSAASSGGAGGTAEPATASTAATQSADQNVSPRARQRAEELDVDLSGVEGTGFEGAVTEADVEAAAESESAEPQDVQASPRARQRAEELDVDLSGVEGTGFDGAVTEEDVEAAAETQVDADATTAADTGVQVAADDDLGTYQRTTAVADPAAGEALVETMEAVRTAFEERVTMTDVLVVVASAALTDQPVLNGTYTEATHQVQETQHIALVTDSEGERREGVIEAAAGRSLTDIVEARQAIDGSDAAAESPPTFTLANAAEADVDGRLVNPPAVAALTVDATGQRAVPTDDGVDLQPLVTASLTFDTRAVGENEASAFLDALFERATRASELVLESYRGTE